MPRVAIDVLLKPEILDPQGRAVENALPGLGYEGVANVRVGKHLELDVDAAGGDLAQRIDELCADFLTNPARPRRCVGRGGVPRPTSAPARGAWTTGCPWSLAGRPCCTAGSPSRC